MNPTVNNDTSSGTIASALSGSRSDRASATAAGDFQSFLTLLTAQLRHQDPLSPLDSTQFVEQLASFSAVEQQIETNRLLEDLAGGMTRAGLETATLWIGKDVEAPAERVRFSGEPLRFTIPAGAEGEIVVRSASNDVVYRESVAPGAVEFTWNGVNLDGAEAPVADYRITIEGKDAEDAATSTPLNIVSRVFEARMVDGAVRLILESGAVIDPASVSAVRSPVEAAPQTS